MVVSIIVGGFSVIEGGGANCGGRDEGKTKQTKQKYDYIILEEGAICRCSYVDDAYPANCCAKAKKTNVSSNTQQGAGASHPVYT